MDSSSEVIDNNSYLNNIPSEEMRAIKAMWRVNNLYHRKSSRIKWIINIQAIVIFLMSIGLYFYVSGEMPSDRFFVVNQDNRPRIVQGMYNPNSSRDSLTSWVSAAVTDVMTFGFNDIEQRFDITKKNFTKAGWDSFREAMMKSGFVSSVIDGKQMVTAAPRSTPILLKDGYVKGNYMWMFQLDLLMTFRSGSNKRNEVKKVNVKLERVPTSENPNGVGIAELMLF